MSSSFDGERVRREISILVDEVNAGERLLALPEIDGLYDTDRLEALDIINRIERRMLSKEAPVTRQAEDAA